MSYTKRSPEEIEAQTESLREQAKTAILALAATVDEEAAGERIAEYLKTQARFYKYSPSNVALIVMQKPNATYVASYTDWAKMRRHPRGHTGLKILCPSKYNKNAKDKTLPPDWRIGGFKPGTVFDISDTDGEPLPALDYWRDEGDEGEELYKALQQVAADNNITVKEMGLGRSGGWSTGGATGINVSNPMLAKASAMAHELGHEFLHWDSEEGKALPRDIKELEAEAVAYVVCTHFGYEVKAAQYIALWKHNGDAVTRRLRQIQLASEKIIKGLYAVLGRQEIAMQGELQ